MNTSYNRFAGQSVKRPAALSDGVSLVAMTLLLVELRVRAREFIDSERDLRHALLAPSPELLVYLMSFITLGIFWVGQQTQLNFLERSDRHLTWIHLAFRFSVTIKPFSTSVLIELLSYRTALLAYSSNILLLGLLAYATWGRATQASLLKLGTRPGVPAAVCRRICLTGCRIAFRPHQKCPAFLAENTRPLVVCLTAAFGEIRCAMSARKIRLLM